VADDVGALVAALDATRYHIESDDGEDVLVKKKSGPDFAVELLEDTVKGTHIDVDRSKQFDPGRTSADGPGSTRWPSDMLQERGQLTWVRLHRLLRFPSMRMRRLLWRPGRARMWLYILRSSTIVKKQCTPEPSVPSMQESAVGRCSA